MTEEIKTQEKNTVATVGMRFSIIWLIALITIVWTFFWLPLLFVWFILWIIGLFSKPRAKARVAVIIPLIVFIAGLVAGLYLYKSVKTPVQEFKNRSESKMERVSQEWFDEDSFNKIFESELNLLKNKTNEEWKALYENSTGSNSIEKITYLVLSSFQEAFETSMEKYNNNELPEIDDEVVEEDIELVDEEDVAENKEENSKTETVEVFNEAEQDDIQQILNLLQ